MFTYSIIMYINHEILSWLNDIRTGKLDEMSLMNMGRQR